MDTPQQDRLLALTYDAVLDGSRWRDVLFALAEATGSIQTTIEIFDPYSGIATRLAPLCDPDYQRSYQAYWGSQFTLWRKTDRFAPGRIFTSADIADVEQLRASAFYNEWWRPQGNGGASIMSNLLADGRATALVAAYKPFGRAFTDEEERLFRTTLDHMIRAVAMHRRLHLAEVRAGGTVGGGTAPGFVVIDPAGHILSGPDTTLALLRAAGLIEAGGAQGRIGGGNAGIARLLADLTAGAGGALSCRTRDGDRLRITAVPCGAGEGRAQWLPIDRPAALLHVLREGEEEQERVRRLVSAYALTPAEARVALEIARGDGRAAVAGRLGIRETTVRSHLSAVFDKLGINRQAQLAAMVARA